MSRLLHPEDIRARCRQRFAREHLSWLGEGGAALEAQTVALGMPTQSQAAAAPEAVRSWATAWAIWERDRQPGQVLWETRQWPRLGEQRLPLALRLRVPDDVAALSDDGARWLSASARLPRLLSVCPWVIGRPAPQRLFDALADYADHDVERLLALLRWALEHPASGLQLRELPVIGLDTKWVEHRRGLIIDVLQGRCGQADSAGGPAAGRDLHALLGLTPPPIRLRLRLLGDDLRRTVGGLGDIEAPLDELASLPVSPRLAFIVENLESGLALPPIPGAVAVMKLGHAVHLLQRLPWLPAARVVVWGDIDTHGLAILDRVRSVLPQAESMLMDRQTLLGHRPLWVEEPRPHAGPPLQHLNAEERSVLEGLQAHAWGVRVRLEQERLPWPVVLAALARF